MIEKVLLLIYNKQLLEVFHLRLKSYGVEVVDAFTDEKSLQMDELRHRYDIIVVDKSFLGNVRNTCQLVWKMRRAGFDKPIVAIEHVPHDGMLFSMLVAGCNFGLSGIEQSNLVHFGYELCMLVAKISNTMPEAFQLQS